MILGCMIVDEKGVVCETWQLADVILGCIRFLNRFLVCFFRACGHKKGDGTVYEFAFLCDFSMF